MRYALIRSMDVVNGLGIGTALFTQGCPFHCKNCFNESTWNYKGGKEWTDESLKDFLNLCEPEYINRVSILGGEPLIEENLDDLYLLLAKIKNRFGENKSIWLYTGFTWEELINNQTASTSGVRKLIIKLCDVVIDGKYIDELRDVRLKFRGSSNQRIIDVKESLKQNKTVLFME